MKRTFMLAAVMSLVLAASNVFGSHSTGTFRPEERNFAINGYLKRTVERGGWLIVSGKKKFLIVNAGKYKGNSWFVVGAKVEATGSLRNHPTFFMEGHPFKVNKLTPRTSGAPLNASHGNGEVFRSRVEIAMI